MPRIIFASIITAAIVSVLTSFLVIGQLRNQMISNSEIETDGAAEGSVSDTRSIFELESELKRISSQLDQLTDKLTRLVPTSQLYNDGEIEARFNELELQLEKIGSRNEQNEYQSQPVRRSKISEIVDQTDEALEQQRYVAAEQDFMDDSGLPIGQFANSIGDVFHGIVGLEMTGMECKSSVCRVSYDNNENLTSSKSQDREPEWQVMDNLLELSGDKEVDIRHAVDSSGNALMYIRLR